MKNATRQSHLLVFRVNVKKMKVYLLKYKRKLLHNIVNKMVLKY